MRLEIDDQRGYANFYQLLIIESFFICHHANLCIFDIFWYSGNEIFLG